MYTSDERTMILITSALLLTWLPLIINLAFGTSQ